MSNTRTRQVCNLPSAATLCTVLLLAACTGNGSEFSADDQPGDADVAGSTTIVAPSEPDARGPHAVGHDRREFVDPDSGRVLTTTVWYPAAAGQASDGRYEVIGFPVDPTTPMGTGIRPADGQFPLVTFSHGQGGLRIQSSFLMETLASHGYIVASADHLGDSMLSAEAPMPHEMRALRTIETVALIDAMLRTNDDGSSPWSGHLDADRIATAGHSLGGYGAFTASDDPRVDAVVAIAPGPVMNIEEDQLATFDKPILVLGGTEDVNTPIDSEGGPMFDKVASEHRYRVDLEGAGHMSFTIICGVDQYLTDPSIPDNIGALLDMINTQNCGAAAPSMPDERAHALTNRYVVSFLNTHLVGDDRYAEFLTGTAGAYGYDASNPPPTTTVPEIELYDPDDYVSCGDMIVPEQTADATCDTNIEDNTPS